MKSFKGYIEEKTLDVSTVKLAVKDYFSNNKKVRDKALKTLKNMAQSQDLKDDVAKYMLDHGAKLGDFQRIGLTEESSAPTTTTANIPNPVDTAQGPMGSTYAEPADSLNESYDDYFMGCPVFDVSCDVHEKFRTGKNRYHRWDKYLDMEDTQCQKVYDYAKTKSPTSIILRNKTGVMIHVRPQEFVR